MKYSYSILLLCSVCISACSSGPSFTPDDRKAYEDLMRGSPEDWPHWFPQPSWHRQALIGTDKVLLSTNVKNSIAACSGGLSWTSAKTDEFALRIEGLLRIGKRSTKSVAEAIEGISFSSGDLQTTESDAAYKQFTDCILARLDDPYSKCLSVCAGQYDRSIRKVFDEYAICMNKTVFNCTNECTYRHNKSWTDCNERYCRRELPKNILKWGNRCEDDTDVLYEIDNHDETLNRCERECG